MTETSQTQTYLPISDHNTLDALSAVTRGHGCVVLFASIWQAVLSTRVGRMPSVSRYPGSAKLKRSALRTAQTVTLNTDLRKAPLPSALPSGQVISSWLERDCP